MAYTRAREGYSPRARLCSRQIRKSKAYQNGWVVLFIAACSFVYFHSVGKKNEVVASLDRHLSKLQLEKASLLQQKEDLLLQINSQSDPAWIQLTLMKGLGLVPEGQLKVYFHSDGE
jgi:hypothetical protein